MKWPRPFLRNNQLKRLITDAIKAGKRPSDVAMVYEDSLKDSGVACYTFDQVVMPAATADMWVANYESNKKHWDDVVRKKDHRLYIAVKEESWRRQREELVRG